MAVELRPSTAECAASFTLGTERATRFTLGVESVTALPTNRLIGRFVRVVARGLASPTTGP
jgi:hypothetical protein